MRPRGPHLAMAAMGCTLSRAVIQAVRLISIKYVMLSILICLIGLLTVPYIQLPPQKRRILSTRRGTVGIHVMDTHAVVVARHPVG